MQTLPGAAAQQYLKKFPILHPRGELNYAL